MVSKFALLSNIFLATIALAAPSSLVEDPLAHRSEDRQPIHGVVSRADSDASSMILEGTEPNWAGAFWSPHPDPVTSVTATFTIPYIHNLYGYVNIFLAIDGRMCKSSGILGGVSFAYDATRVTGYAWRKLRGQRNKLLTTRVFPVNMYDTIEITIRGHNSHKPTVNITNHNTGISDYSEHRTLDSNPICQYNAELIVEAPLMGDSGCIDPFALFDEVNFKNIFFNEIPGIPPRGTLLLDMLRNGVWLTNTTTTESRDTLTVRRINP